MINIKYCRKCKRAYDYEECPYCRQRELKGGKENEMQNNNLHKEI